MISSYFLFANTRSVVKSEAVCQDRNYRYQVHPVPREVSAECGLALVVAEDTADRLASALLAEAIDFRIWKKPQSFDLLSLVSEGGCSAKLSAIQLRDVVSELQLQSQPQLLVGAGDFDDAGVIQLNDDQALIETTDFFPPVCSDPYTFGQIAAANALSDVYAMGGEVLTAMNIVMFPADGVPLSVLREILEGGAAKVKEAGGLLVGGHTINDPIPKYGLAVTGLVHPQRIIKNSAARPGDVLILTKGLGVGILQSGKKCGSVGAFEYAECLQTMSQLNRAASQVMQRFSILSATDITGFGLLGHAQHIARGSGVSLEFSYGDIPLLPGVNRLAEQACIPGGAFRNEQYVADNVVWDSRISWSQRMILFDPQTSGGVLMAVAENQAESIRNSLIECGYEKAAIVGVVKKRGDKDLYIQGEGRVCQSGAAKG